MMIESLSASGAALISMPSWSSRFLSQTILPVSLSVAITRPSRPVDRDDEIVPERDAAVAVGLLLAGIHLPEDAAVRAGAHVDLVDHAPDVGHVHEAVVDQRRRFEVFVRRRAAERDREGELEVLDVRLVDRVERREALRAEVAMVHQPVLRLGLEQALVGHVGRQHAGGAGKYRRAAHERRDRRRVRLEAHAFSPKCGNVMKTCQPRRARNRRRAPLPNVRGDLPDLPVGPDAAHGRSAAPASPRRVDLPWAPGAAAARPQFHDAIGLKSAKISRWTNQRSAPDGGAGLGRSTGTVSEGQREEQDHRAWCGCRQTAQHVTSAGGSVGGK